MLLATLNSVVAIVRNWPWHSTNPSRWALASKWLAASTNGMPVSSARTSQTRRPKSACVLMPVPTAVPPIGNSNSASMATAARPSERSNCRASPPISCPSESGVASARCVRPILRTSFHSAAFAASTSLALFQSGNQSFADRHGGGDVDGGRKHVVAALAQVDVVVRMDRLVVVPAGPICSSTLWSFPEIRPCPLFHRPVRSARLAITSLAFMLLDVPEPV